MSETTDLELLRRAIELSRNSPPVQSAFSVGALLADGSGQVFATGYSREGDPHQHAEEATLAKVATNDSRLATSTIYSSLEPCSTRASRRRSCAELILDAGIPRVVFAWREPAVFVTCQGAETLQGAGIDVVELPELAPLVRAINAHLM